VVFTFQFQKSIKQLEEKLKNLQALDQGSATDSKGLNPMVTQAFFHLLHFNPLMVK